MRREGEGLVNACTLISWSCHRFFGEKESIYYCTVHPFLAAFSWRYGNLHKDVDMGTKIVTRIDTLISFAAQKHQIHFPFYSLLAPYNFENSALSQWLAYVGRIAGSAKYSRVIPVEPGVSFKRLICWRNLCAINKGKSYIEERERHTFYI